MTLIEGVGDEVVHFFLLLAVALIAVIAWWSTNLTDRPLVTTLFIVERPTIQRAAADAQAVAQDATESSDISPEENEIIVEERKTSNADRGDEVDASAVQEGGDEETGSTASSSDVTSQDAGGNLSGNEVRSVGETVVRKRIVASFEVREEEEEEEEEDEEEEEEEGNSTEENNCQTENRDDGNIRIRLKYLNEDQKLVEGKLQEQLGDFKRRHFSLELAGRKLVRLIFNGQVLQEDTKTLQNCGFFDNCVVHCVVQSRTPPPSPNLNRSRGESRRYHDASEAWDFAHFLYVSLTLLLGLAWYGRYQYAQLYTATTTVALVGLTGIFTVSLIGMYMPDPDGVRT